MNNNIRNEELLQDLDSQGRARPWKEKKRGSMNLASSYSRLKLDKSNDWNEIYNKYEFVVRDCATYLEFAEVITEVGSRKKLVQMYTCQKRLCAMCNWRKSIKVFTGVSKVMDMVIKQVPDIQPVFLTLTQRNCNFESLEKNFKNIFEGFRRLVNNRTLEEQTLGWFRALEVTYNKKTDTWHPHLHVIMLFPKSYFSKTNKRYIDQAEWVRLWRLSMRLDYDPNVDVRRVKPKDGNKRKAIAEVAKYPLKDKQIFSKDLELTDRLVDCLTKALYRKRLFAYGGIMAKVAKQLKLDKLDEGDLVKVGNDETMRADVATALVSYRWDFGLLDYIRVR